MRTLTFNELLAVSGGAVGNTGNPVVLALALARNAAGTPSKGLNIASTPVLPPSMAG